MEKLFLMMFVVTFHFLCVAYPMPHPFPPFRIMGNLYYVGTDDLASYLIVTRKGNILINSNLEVNVPMIKASEAHIAQKKHEFYEKLHSQQYVLASEKRE